MGNDKTTTTTTTPSTSTSPPGSLLSDLIAGGKALISRKKRMKEAEDVSADSGNPAHYQTHVNDARSNRQGAKKGITLHHRKS